MPAAQLPVTALFIYWLALAFAQTVPSITVTNLVQCGTAEADLVGGVLPYTVAGKSFLSRAVRPLRKQPSLTRSTVRVTAFIENEKVSSSDNTFIVTQSGAYQFQLTQKAGTKLTFQLTDAEAQTAVTNAATVGKSSDKSCLTSGAGTFSKPSGLRIGAGLAAVAVLFALL